MKHVHLIALFCLLCIAEHSAQNSEIVYIRVQEASKTSASGFESKIVVIKPDNTTEVISLQRLDPAGDLLVDNGIVIKKEIAKWMNKGYKVRSQSSSGGDNITRTEFLMIKE